MAKHRWAICSFAVQIKSVFIQMNCNYQLGEWQRRKKLLSQIQHTSIFLMAQPPLTVQVQIEYRFYVFRITRFQHKFIFMFNVYFIPLIHFPHSTVSSLTYSSLRWVFLVFPNHVFIMNRFQHKRNVLKYVFLFICLLIFFFTLVFALKIIFYFSQVSFVIEDKTENIECARRIKRNTESYAMFKDTQISNVIDIVYFKHTFHYIQQFMRRKCTSTKKYWFNLLYILVNVVSLDSAKNRGKKIISRGGRERELRKCFVNDFSSFICVVVL